MTSDRLLTLYHRLPSALQSAAATAQGLALRSWRYGPDKGDGALEATRREIVELGLEGAVGFAGARCSRGDRPVPRWCRHLPQHDELRQHAGQRSRSHGECLCIVSTNVGGVPFLFEDDRDALLVPRDDIAAMSAAVRRLLAEHELARRLSSAAREEAEQFDWSFVISQRKALLREVA